MRNSEIQTKISEESLTNRLNEMKDRISGFEDNLKEFDHSINGKVRLLSKSQDMDNQELWDTIRRPNLGIISIDKGEVPKSETYKVFSTKP